MAKKKKFIGKFHMNWKSFFSGIAIGLVISFLLFYVFGKRYEIKSFGPSGVYTIKLDKWTGKSWMMRYYEDKGNKDFFWKELWTEKIISTEELFNSLPDEQENPYLKPEEKP